MSLLLSCETPFVLVPSQARQLNQVHSIIATPPCSLYACWVHSENLTDLESPTVLMFTFPTYPWSSILLINSIATKLIKLFSATNKFLLLQMLVLAVIYSILLLTFPLFHLEISGTYQVLWGIPSWLRRE